MPSCELGWLHSMLLADSRTVGIKGINMTCKPLGARHPFPPGNHGSEVLLLTPCSRWESRLEEVMSEVWCAWLPALRHLRRLHRNGRNRAVPAWATPLPLPSEHGICCQPLRTKAMQPWNSHESPLPVCLEPSPGLANQSWEGICSSFPKEGEANGKL